jgi:hypothetical protein
MKPADPLDGLLPPAPPARDLPDRDRHRRELLAAVRAGRSARPRPATVGWLAPLGAALAVLVILTGVFVLPGLFSGARHTGSTTPVASGHPTASDLHRQGRWARRAVGYQVRSTVGMVVIHGGVGSVSVTGTARSTVSVSAHLAYRGRDPVLGRQIRRGVLELSDTCGTCRISYDLAVPRGLGVIVHYSVGQIRLTGLGGTVSVYTGTGQIQASGLSVRQAQLTTGTGAISAAFTVPPQRVVASTGVGSVTIRVPATVAYRVAASADIGTVTVAVPRSARAGHAIQASTGTGTITVADH